MSISKEEEKQYHHHHHHHHRRQENNRSGHTWAVASQLTAHLLYMIQIHQQQCSHLKNGNNNFIIIVDKTIEVVTPGQWAVASQPTAPPFNWHLPATNNLPQSILVRF